MSKLCDYSIPDPQVKYRAVWHYPDSSSLPFTTLHYITLHHYSTFLNARSNVL